MAISQNFPNTRPSLNLNFARSKKLDPRITFTRSSTATYVDEDGLIKSVATNTPRFDHDPTTGDCLGLLIEESRTNLLQRSNTFNTLWSAVSATCVFTQNITGPDGVVNGAWTIDDQSTASDGAGFEQALTITPSASTNYCLSIFAKQGTATYFDFYAFFTGTSVKGSKLRYNFSTDTITVASEDGGGISPTIYGKVQYPNGWVRLYFVVNDANSGLNNALQYRIYPASRDTSVTGTTLFYGAQCEIGSFPTTYIPTVASTVTRSADNASMTGTNFSSWYNQSEGTLYASIRNQTVRSSLTYDRFVALCGDDVNLNEISIYTQTASGGALQNKFLFAITAGGTASADFNAAGPDNIGKAILAYKTNDAAGTVNGITPGTDTSVTLPTCTNLQICGAVRYQSKPTATISQLSYYPVRLTNSQLQTLTK